MMPRTPRDLSTRLFRSHRARVTTRATSSWVAAAVSMAIVGTSIPAAAMTAPRPSIHMSQMNHATRSAQPDNAPASVLGLDSDKPKVGQALTAALRKAFANRGLSGGEEISLEEMRLTMGCDDDGVVCLAEGGKTLGVNRLVFGYLRSTGKGKFQITIQLLDTESAAITSDASIDLTRDQLSDENIDATAAEIVRELMPKDEDDELPPQADPLPMPAETEPETEPEPSQSNIYFGIEKPTPRWKWIGFGTSLGLTVLAGGATAGMGVWLTSKNGGFRGQLIDAAEASLEDDSDINDVDPNLPQGINLCEFARSRPNDANGNPLGEPGQVRNASVVKICNKGDDVRKAQLAAGIGTAVFGVATLAFTGLLLIHKRKPGVDAMIRHDVQLGISPTLNGGVSIAGGMRF